MRLSYEELNKVKEEYGVDILWSFSRFNCYRTSKYEYMLKYIEKVKENNDKMSAYAPLGTVCHDNIEAYYDGKLSADSLPNEFDDAFTVNIDIAGLCFDRCDNIKNENIKTKYYKNLMHYFENFKPMDVTPKLEQFLTIKVTDDIVFQGYADCLSIEDGYCIVTDFKTSSIYKGKKAEKESAQLVLYSEALRQKGFPKDKIKARWAFLKYVDIDCEQVNGKIKTRTVERSEIGNSLQASAKTWLKKYGYEDDLLVYLDALAQSNDIKVLPEDVQKKFIVKDCYVYIDNIWDLYNELKDEIIETIAEINDKTEKYNELKDTNLEAAEHLFWDDDETLKAQGYYFNNLCGYNIPTVKPYKQYLDRINADKSLDLLGLNNKNQNEVKEEDDLSWLNDLL